MENSLLSNYLNLWSIFYLLYGNPPSKKSATSSSGIFKKIILFEHENPKDIELKYAATTAKKFLNLHLGLCDLSNDTIKEIMKHTKKGHGTGNTLKTDYISRINSAEVENFNIDILIENNESILNRWGKKDFQKYLNLFFQESISDQNQTFFCKENQSYQISKAEKSVLRVLHSKLANDTMTSEDQAFVITWFCLLAFLGERINELTAYYDLYAKSISIDQHRTNPKTVESIVQPNADDKILFRLVEEYPLPQITSSLYILNNKLKNEYKKNPNALYIEHWYLNQNLHGIPYQRIIDFMSIYKDFSIEAAADIEIQLALVFVHVGDKTFAQKARIRLEKAERILENIQERGSTDTLFKKIIYAKWLHSITHKLERNFGNATEECELLQLYTTSENRIYGLPYTDSLLLPERELFVINKESDLCRYLLTRHSEIKINTVENFNTTRRMFEYYILSGNFDAAKVILPNVLSSYHDCKMRIDAIYETALFKNLFEFYTYIGEKEEAMNYYRIALQKARENCWKGKEEALLQLNETLS